MSTCTKSTKTKVETKTNGVQVSSLVAKTKAGRKILKTGVHTQLSKDNNDVVL